MVNLLNPPQQVNNNGQERFLLKKAVILNHLWSPVALVTTEHLDVDKTQMRIAMATLSRLFMQSQGCGPHVCTQTIQWLEHWWWHFGWVCSCMSKDWLADCPGLTGWLSRIDWLTVQDWLADCPGLTGWLSRIDWLTVQDWLADCQSHYRMLGLKKKKNRRALFSMYGYWLLRSSYLLCDLHVYVLLMPGSKWTYNCQNLTGCYLVRL